MKRNGLLPFAVALAATALLAAPAFASHGHAMDQRKSDTIWIGGFGGRLHDWNAISRTELILWASPGRPYLVTIHRPASSLRHARTIGVTSTAGRINKFDRIIVNGWSVPIKSIAAIDRDTAKALLRD